MRGLIHYEHLFGSMRREEFNCVLSGKQEQKHWKWSGHNGSNEYLEISIKDNLRILSGPALQLSCALPGAKGTFVGAASFGQHCPWHQKKKKGLLEVLNSWRILPPETLQKGTCYARFCFSIHPAVPCWTARMASLKQVRCHRCTDWMNLGNLTFMNVFIFWTSYLMIYVDLFHLLRTFVRLSDGRL